MIVYMAVDVYDQLIRACATPELAEEWLTRRVETAHGTQVVTSFEQDPLLTAHRNMVVDNEPWLNGAYRIITQEVKGSEPAPESEKEVTAPRTAKK